MTKQKYVYEAVVLKVYDGDTITVSIDLGFSLYQSDVKLRLYGINTPEMNTKEGKDVAERLRARLLNQKVIIETIKDKTEKYGRYLAKVHLGDECINETLVKSGDAKEYLP